MRIAFLISNPVVSDTNGVKIQALTWKKGLEDLGHTVDLIDIWGRNDWAAYDAIHFFSFSEYMTDFVGYLKKINPKIVLSPIIDSNYTPFQYKLASFLGCKKLRLTSKFHSLRCIKNDVKLYFVRSQYERNFITKGYAIAQERVPIVPLALRLPSCDSAFDREPFCLHVSFLTDSRKNVHRLIQAAVKFKFRLVLAGKLRNNADLQLLNTWIDGHANISYLGFQTDEDLLKLYRTAKVFALPSVYEGVGMVAMEAAANGCNVVVTKLGGPKEYYGPYAKVVDPYDVDDIGNAIVNSLKDDSTQPQLSKYIVENYNLSATMKILEESYQSLNMV